MKRARPKIFGNKTKKNNKKTASALSEHFPKIRTTYTHSKNACIVSTATTSSSHRSCPDFPNCAWLMSDDIYLIRRFVV